MKTYFKILGVILLLFFGACCKKNFNSKFDNDSYKIKKIDSINNWNLIYATKNDSVYKIVVKKDLKYKSNTKIRINNYYKLKLTSKKENVPTVNGIKISPVNNLDVQCYDFDEVTKICLELDKGIYDLYLTESIRGL